MEAEMIHMDDPGMRQMLEQQFAPMRQQCAPGFQERRAAQTPPADPSTYGRYRVVAEQQLEVNRNLPGIFFHVVETRKAEAEFEIKPGTREFGGKSTIHYVSTNGRLMAGECRGDFSLIPVTHSAQLSGRINPNRNTAHIVITDLLTKGRSTGMKSNISCPEGPTHLLEQMIPDDTVFIQNLPLRHGAQITEVTPPNGLARYTVKATVHKL